MFWLTGSLRRSRFPLRCRIRKGRLQALPKKGIFMQFIDMHCDTLLMLMMKDPERSDLYESEFTAVDLKRMRRAHELARFFAVFLPPASSFEELGIKAKTDEEYIAACRDILLKNVKKHSDIIAMAGNADEIEKNKKEGKMSAVLTMEDGRAVLGKMENLKRFYDMGFRAISLTWNYENCFGYPNSSNPKVMKAGLKPFGKEAVEYMQELGILVDVSHLSDGGFWDVVSIAKKPFAATHSDCRAISPHQRNLTDEMIKALSEAGGVAGINFCPEFLNPDLEKTKSSAALMAKHARHMADVGGIECVGIGSDLDGIDGDIEVKDCAHMGLFEDALKKEGFSQKDIERILYKNVLRVIKEAVK